MTDLRKVVQQALEALENLDGIDTESECVTIDVADEITALRAALAQPDVVNAMSTVIAAMQADPDYAWSWHCNVAMAFVDAGGDSYTANQGAARFMRTLAQVEPAHELPAQPDVPQGWVLVPVEPTQAMLDANGTSCVPEDMAWLNENARQTWAAMLAAAPKGGA